MVYDFISNLLRDQIVCFYFFLDWEAADDFHPDNINTDTAKDVIWTILEYVFHRFLFHIDEVLPDQPLFLTLHFLMHGIHHCLWIGAPSAYIEAAAF
jgi:hypothetical protein